MSTLQSPMFRTAYFGKIPSRGDFVKNTSHPQLMSTLDDWVANTMEALAQDPHWKALYDEAQPIQFAILGSRGKLGIAGHLQPSRDLSGRRFPFISATSIEVARPLEFIARSPLAFSRMWNRMGTAASQLMQDGDQAAALQALNDLGGEIRTAADDGFDAFIDLQTLERVEAMLRGNQHAANMHDIVLALGILLEPVMSSGSSQLDTGLALPLPDDPLYINLVASYWMALIAPFLARADFEIALFIGRIAGTHRLVVGFRGASPQSLASLLSTPQTLAQHYIVLEEAPWVREHVRASYGLAKLSSYLDQPRLSLRQAQDTFREVFIGA
ncbi:type VI secretion-associated protein [Bordetella genomosp. 5]|uniref:Type VI secretion-associated protein n=1 Tax=Bordetella genomosp. 5 TaxID=1395608 RepID=A0A261TIJ7_9BORD|nr:type VI secretion system-associated protein TagF [Bordetella genomosp. 5]OZI39647.1 type VI secretion-associated protein [Bordetella genomosp. 5]OZI49012.1 type VI secretion-associated protein [Bordetella genomosp. 5]